MRLVQLWLWCILLVAANGCQPVSVGKETFVTNTPLLSAHQPGKMDVTPPTPAQTRVGKDVMKGVPLPAFLEVIQTTRIGETVAENPAIGVGPPLYFYNPESKVLMLSPKVTLESGTEILIGVSLILQTSDQLYEKKEIIPYPSVQPALIEIVAHDPATDTLTVTFAGEKFDLGPGETRTFKQTGAGSNISTNITLITNYGRLTEIEILPSDGSWR